MVPTLCSIPECPKLATNKATGWCRMHYTRYKRHGDPSVKNPPSRPRPVSDVMAEYVPNRPAGGCWEWQGERVESGYGRVSRGPRRMLAHRFVYEAMVGPLEAGRVLMHSCDNPPCVNPAHLTPGTDAENTQDCVSKDRHARGERQAGAKLGPDDVMDIRRRAGQSEPMAAIAADYQAVTEGTINQIIRGSTWKHLPVTYRGQYDRRGPAECVGCGRAIRPSRTRSSDYPNTVIHAGRGLCGRCKREKEKLS